MGWVPDRSWLTYLRVDAPAGDLTYDLAIDGSGAGLPDPAMTGLVSVATGSAGAVPSFTLVAILAVLLVTIAAAVRSDRRSSRRPVV